MFTHSPKQRTAQDNTRSVNQTNQTTAPATPMPAHLRVPRYLGNSAGQAQDRDPRSHRLIQRACACGGTADTTGECPACRARRLATPGGALQAKLTIGRPDDPFEREADRVADAVVYGSHHAGGYALTAGGTLQRIEQKDADSPPEVEPEEEARHPVAVKMPSTPRNPANQEEEETAGAPIQRKAASPRAGGTSVQAANVPAALGGSSGRTLPATVQSEMGPRFGADFRGVRIHTGNRANQLCQSVAAKAFTYRNHIYFAQNQYQPESTAGKHLLAHELTHTIQQQASPIARDVAQRQLADSVTATSPRVQRAVDTSVLLHTFSLSGLQGAIPASGNGTVDDTLRGIEGAALDNFSSRNPVLSMSLNDEWRYYASSSDFCRTHGTRSSALARLWNCAYWHYVADDEYNLTFRYRHTATRRREGSFATSSGRTRSRQTTITTGAKVSYSILELSASRSETESEGSSATTTVTATNFHEHDYDVSLDYRVKYFNPSDFRITNDFLPDMTQVSGPHRRSGSVDVGSVTLYDDDSNPDNLSP